MEGLVRSCMHNSRSRSISSRSSSVSLLPQQAVLLHSLRGAADNCCKGLLAYASTMRGAATLGHHVWRAARGWQDCAMHGVVGGEVAVAMHES